MYSMVNFSLEMLASRTRSSHDILFCMVVYESITLKFNNETDDNICEGYDEFHQSSIVVF